MSLESYLKKTVNHDLKVTRLLSADAWAITENNALLKDLYSLSGNDKLKSVTVSFEAVDYALTMNIIRAGEISKNIPQALKQKFKEIPWDRFKSIRDITTHHISHVNDIGIEELNRKLALIVNISPTKSVLEIDTSRMTDEALLPFANCVNMAFKLFDLRNNFTISKDDFLKKNPGLIGKTRYYSEDGTVLFTGDSLNLVAKTLEDANLYNFILMADRVRSLPIMLKTLIAKREHLPDIDILNLYRNHAAHDNTFELEKKLTSRDYKDRIPSFFAKIEKLPTIVVRYHEEYPKNRASISVGSYMNMDLHTDYKLYKDVSFQKLSDPKRKTLDKAAKYFIENEVFNHNIEQAYLIGMAIISQKLSSKDFESLMSSTIESVNTKKPEIQIINPGDKNMTTDIACRYLSNIMHSILGVQRSK